jgi:TetR/AcrR family transcriptional repressor of nem operon
MGRIKEFKDNNALEKAMMLFWQKGYHNTSLKDLLSEMNILNGSFYNTFGNKKNIFLRSLDHYDSLLKEHKNETFSSCETFKVGIRKFFDDIFQKSKDKNIPDGCFFVNTITAENLQDADINSFISKRSKEFTLFFEKRITIGIENKELDKSIDPKLTAVLLATYIQGLTKSTLLSPSTKQLKKQTEHFLDALGI